MQDVQFLDPVGLAPEGTPVKTSPVPVLQIDQNGQDEKHSYAGQNAFLIHEEAILIRIPMPWDGGKR